MVKPDPIEELNAALGEIIDLERVAGLLGWDQQAMMPTMGALSRARQRATIALIAHERFVSDDVGRLLDAVEAATAEDDYQSPGRSLARVTRRSYDKERRVPKELAAEMSEAASNAHEAWVAAREDSDFEQFLPSLERGLELRQRYIGCFEGAAHPYDYLLEDYEPGTTTADVQAIFADLKEGLVPLVRDLREHGEPVDTSLLTQAYPLDGQQAFVRQALGWLGFDERRWRLDTVVHPFALRVGEGDIRITTRYFENYLPAGIFGAMHEFGHGLYEAGVAAEFDRTPLERLSSLGLHESQSRLWENLVGRSRAFWDHAFPALQEACPDELSNTGVEDFHRTINRVEPSLIRVEADEVTYNLHIILRFELELALVEGTLDVADLPTAWNERVGEYLGIEVPDDAHGVLQDPHWCFGFGYFPTYALGNLVAAQLWRRIRTDIPALDQEIAAGDFTPLREWLVENVHSRGSTLTLNETLDTLLGEGLSAQPHLDYLRTKYGELYGLPSAASA
ncbi:MAG: carboxypeptidase M32 [Gaiellaceae bacterium]